MQSAATKRVWKSEPATEKGEVNDAFDEREMFYEGAVSGVFDKPSELGFDHELGASVDGYDDEVARAEWEGMGQCQAYQALALLDEPLD